MSLFLLGAFLLSWDILWLLRNDTLTLKWKVTSLTLVVLIYIYGL